MAVKRVAPLQINAPRIMSVFARIAVREKTKERCAEHVTDENTCGQKSEISISGVEFLFDKRLYGEENGAVDVVEEVQRCDQSKGRAGGFRGAAI